MKLSAPIYVLKDQAKKLKKEKTITTTEALNVIAKREGYNSWSIMISKEVELLPNSYSELLDYFNNGDLISIGARPGIGKTSFALGLFVKAVFERKKSFFFSLSEVQSNIISRISKYNQSVMEKDFFFDLDTSDDISADYIIERTKDEISNGDIIVIDYLQRLDEKRSLPDLQIQVEKLKNFSKEKKCLILFITQLDRSLEERKTLRPTLSDIRLPNPLDLNLFNKIILLSKKQKNSKEVEVSFVGKTKHTFKVGWDGTNTRFFDLQDDQMESTG